jgi:hypothetical protein
MYGIALINPSDDRFAFYDVVGCCCGICAFIVACASQFQSHCLSPHFYKLQTDSRVRSGAAGAIGREYPFAGLQSCVRCKEDHPKLRARLHRHRKRSTLHIRRFSYPTELDERPLTQASSYASLRPVVSCYQRHSGLVSSTAHKMPHGAPHHHITYVKPPERGNRSPEPFHVDRFFFSHELRPSAHSLRHFLVAPL